MKILRISFLLLFVFLLGGCTAIQPGNSSANYAKTKAVAGILETVTNKPPTTTRTFLPATSTTTATPSPIPATSTPTGFQPGDPTATPLGSDITNPDFIAGLKADKAKDYEEEVRLMTAVIQAEPDLAPAYRYRGIAYWGLHDCQSGFEDENKALALNPDYAGAWADLALLLQDCQGDETEMLADYQKAFSIDPSLAFAHENLGDYYYGIGDSEKALEEFQAAIAIDQGRGSSWSGMSEALWGLGRYDDCIQAATTAIKYDSTYWYAYAYRADCYLAEDENYVAIADYKVYLDHFPQDNIAWYNYGIALKNFGQLQDALTAYTKALELDPTYYEADINRGNVYIQLEEYNQALDDFNAALQYGDIPAAYSGRGYVYYYWKQYDRAIKEFQTSVSMYPSACAYNGLALSDFAVGQYQDALDAADNSNQIDPTCGGSKLAEIQARSYYALGNYDQALIYINKALNIQQFLLGYYYRGIIYQASGQDAAAIQDLENFIKFAPINNYSGPEVADAIARLKKLSP